MREGKSLAQKKNARIDWRLNFGGEVTVKSGHRAMLGLGDCRFIANPALNVETNVTRDVLATLAYMRRPSRPAMQRSRLPGAGLPAQSFRGIIT